MEPVITVAGMPPMIGEWIGLDCLVCVLVCNDCCLLLCMITVKINTVAAPCPLARRKERNFNNFNDCGAVRDLKFG